MAFDFLNLQAELYARFKIIRESTDLLLSESIGTLNDHQRQALVYIKRSNTYAVDLVDEASHILKPRKTRSTLDILQTLRDFLLSDLRPWLWSTMTGVSYLLDSLNDPDLGTFNATQEQHLSAMKKAGHTALQVIEYYTDSLADTGA
jgi:hypothetical protein